MKMNFVLIISSIIFSSSLYADLSKSDATKTFECDSGWTLKNSTSGSKMSLWCEKQGKGSTTETKLGQSRCPDTKSVYTVTNFNDVCYVSYTPPKGASTEGSSKVGCNKKFANNYYWNPDIVIENQVNGDCCRAEGGNANQLNCRIRDDRKTFYDVYDCPTGRMAWTPTKKCREEVHRMGAADCPGGTYKKSTSETQADTCVMEIAGEISYAKPTKEN